MVRRKRRPKSLVDMSQVERAICLAGRATPLVAELYRLHAAACAAGVSVSRKIKRRRSDRPAQV